MKNGDEIEERRIDMKSFFTTFALCYIVLLILAIFCFGLIYNNFYGLLAAVALPIAATIEGFTYMEGKIEKLEKRIEELEGKKKDETENIDG